jgi:DNA sulfur modification protein DndB
MRLFTSFFPDFTLEEGFMFIKGGKLFQCLAEVSTLQGEIKKRRDPFLHESIKKVRLQEYLDEGWVLEKEHARTARVKKAKPHDILLEDRTWALLARLGFPVLNKDRLCKIDYSKDSTIPGKQIDVFAANSDTVVVVECKSSPTKKVVNFSKEIGELGHIKEGVNTTIKKSFTSKPKVAWIFLTQNIILSKSDKARLDEIGILHFSDEDILYYENLVDLLGSVACYQLLGKLFKNQTIPGLEYLTPAVKGKLGGFTTYSFSVEPIVLLKIGFVLHRTDSNLSAFDSYQRMVSKARIKDIERYINEGGFFPNSIIINFNTKKPLRFDEVKSCEHCSQSDVGILHLPNRYHSAFIIDGQHRLYGYGNTEWKDKNTVPVVAFENLPEERQTRIFVDINHEQKSVPTNLLMTLMGEFNWGSDNADEALGAVKARLIDRLNSAIESPLNKRIRVADEKGSEIRCLTKNYLTGQALNKTHFFGTTQKKKIIKTGSLWAGDYQTTLEKAYEFLSACFQLFEAGVPDQWAKGSMEGGFISMNAGVSSIIRVIDDIVEFLGKTESVDFGKLTGAAIAEKVKPYLLPGIDFLKTLSLEEIKKLRSHVGGSAVDIVLREFQNVINLEFYEFSPEGLAQWQKESTGKFNEDARKIGDEMQLKVREFIFATLKEKFGTKDDRWWTEGVPKDIQKRCSNERIEQGEGPDQKYMLLLDYAAIIKHQKDLLLNTFTAKDMKSASVEKRLNWFVQWNKIRNKYSHPEKGNVTEEEYAYLKETREWLSKVI